MDRPMGGTAQHDTTSIVPWAVLGQFKAQHGWAGPFTPILWTNLLTSRLIQLVCTALT